MKSTALQNVLFHSRWVATPALLIFISDLMGPKAWLAPKMWISIVLVMWLMWAWAEFGFQVARGRGLR